MALFSFRQAELFFLGGAAAPPAPLGRTPVILTLLNIDIRQYSDKVPILAPSLR